MSPKTVIYLAAPKARVIRDEIPDRKFSEFVSLLIRSSKRNNDEADRELAQRELDLFLEKIGA